MRRPLLNRRVATAVIVVGGLLTLALWPAAVPVDVGSVVRGPLVVLIEEEGQTRVRDRYVVSAPVAGRVERIDLEPGDQVTRGQAVARVRAEAAPLLDARTRAEAQAALESARATLGRAQAEERRAEAALSQAQREAARLRDLAASRVVSAQELEVKEAEGRTAEQTARAATFAVRAATSEVQRAAARVAPPSAAPGRVMTVVSPADGVVLKRMRESEAVVPAGDPLLEIGNPAALEIVADLLSTDAVRVRPGARTMIEEWGGHKTLDARVRRVEPAGFTKISALGVEEQRVNVILDFTDPNEAWAALGDAYRVEVRIVEWEAHDVLKVPTSALFRDGPDWAVYVVQDGRVHRTHMTLGHQTGQEAEVVGGVGESTRVVLHPADSLSNGARVRVRPAS